MKANIISYNSREMISKDSFLDRSLKEGDSRRSRILLFYTIMNNCQYYCNRDIRRKNNTTIHIIEKLELRKKKYLKKSILL